MSSCLNTDQVNAVTEIGATYYRPDVRGGAVNPAAKRLLLAHAFDGGARRVQFKVDALNAASRAAVLKLGAAQEGILRQDRVTWTGRIRDTVVFSILADEWPQVRAKLDARLATFA
jgi:RimJ/RimL family protein N-acetyltransferase